MSPPQKTPGLSVFFPAYNDSGTIGSLVISAVQAAATLTPDYEVLVINDGSQDETAHILDELARVYPGPRAHRPPREEPRLWRRASLGVRARRQGPGVLHRWRRAVRSDGNGRRSGRASPTMSTGSTAGRSVAPIPLHRIVIGRIYHHTVKLLFGLKVRDVDCDFRLMRRHIFDVVQLEKNSGVICLEMMKKFQDAGFRVAEVPVHHYHRAFGKSQFFNFRRIFRTGYRRHEALVGAGHPARAPRRAARPRRGAAGPAGVMNLAEFYGGRRVMITGGLGFIGSNLAHALAELRRRRAARRLAHPRLRRQPAQHRRHRGPCPRQRRRRPAGHRR